MDEPAAAREATPTTATTPNPLDAIVDLWWDDHFPGSVVAQVTPAWNHAFAAKEELKRRLREGI
jgi:hypothetical protein